MDSAHQHSEMHVVVACLPGVEVGDADLRPDERAGHEDGEHRNDDGDNADDGAGVYRWASGIDVSCGIGTGAGIWSGAEGVRGLREKHGVH